MTVDIAPFPGWKESYADVDAMADAIESLVRDRNYVSCAELRRYIVGAEGDKMAGDENLNVWWLVGISDMAIDAVDQLIKAGRVTMSSAHVLVYLIDGFLPGMPVLKRWPKKPLKSPRWMPITLSLPTRKVVGAQR